MNKEIWKKIPYSDEYEISNLGRVRHLFVNRYDINTKKIKKIPKITYLKPTKRDGYERIRIYENRNKFKTYQVHKLVAEVFIPNPNNYPIVNHKDENKSNNRVENLEWCTYEYNATYSNAKQIYQCDLKGNTLKKWESINLAKRTLKINNIEKCLINKYKTCGGYKWKYVNEF